MQSCSDRLWRSPLRPPCRRTRWRSRVSEPDRIAISPATETRRRPHVRCGVDLGQPLAGLPVDVRGLGELRFDSGEGRDLDDTRL